MESIENRVATLFVVTPLISTRTTLSVSSHQWNYTSETVFFIPWIIIMVASAECAWSTTIADHRTCYCCSSCGDWASHIGINKCLILMVVWLRGAPRYMFQSTRSDQRLIDRIDSSVIIINYTDQQPKCHRTYCFFLPTCPDSTFQKLN